jgi:hypothetical protein
VAKKDSEKKAAEDTIAPQSEETRDTPPVPWEDLAAADGEQAPGQEDPTRPAGDGWRKVTVYWANADPDNKSNPIVVNCVGKYGKKVIVPGVPVWLHERHIARLNDAVIETELQVPEGSGIYSVANPLRAAENQNPGMRARQDPATGLVYLVKRTVQYVISREE